MSHVKFTRKIGRFQADRISNTQSPTTGWRQNKKLSYRWQTTRCTVTQRACNCYNNMLILPKLHQQLYENVQHHSFQNIEIKKFRKLITKFAVFFSFLADRTNGRAYVTVFRLSVVCLSSLCCLSPSVTLCFAASKRCILEQKLPLIAYRKSHIRNRLPDW